MEIAMTKIRIALLAVGTMLAFATPASARDYPYCLQGQGPGYPGLCDFTSYEQCMATASGTRNGCGLNPRAAFGMQQEPRRWHHRH